MPLSEHVTLTALATLTVSVWTVRVALTAAGRRYASALAAVAEAMLFLTVFSHVIDSVDSPTRLAAYGLGVGIGSISGHRLDALFRSMQSARTHAPPAATIGDRRPQCGRTRRRPLARLGTALDPRSPAGAQQVD